MKSSDQSLPIFKVGDLVTIDDSDPWIVSSYPDEIGKVYRVLEVFSRTILINHPKAKLRTKYHWKIAKNTIVKQLIKDLL